MASAKRYSYTLDVAFTSDDEKALFAERVERVRRTLEARDGGAELSNFELLSRLMETVGIVETKAASGEVRDTGLKANGTCTLSCLVPRISFRCLPKYGIPWGIISARPGAQQVVMLLVTKCCS